MKLSIELDRRCTSLVGQAEHYLLVRLDAPERPTSAGRQPLNLALVLDRSGSMSGSKLVKAKEAALVCIRHLSERDRVSVIAYDDQVRVVAASQKVDGAARDRLSRAILAIQAGGSTDLCGGWLRGAQEIAPYLSEQTTLTRAILLSDGLANVGITDNDELAGHAIALRHRGISTTTMGIGADFNEELLERMAIGGGGHFYFIEEAAQIPDVLHRELGELLQISARNIEIRLTAPTQVEVQLLNSFELNRENDTYHVRVDDMFVGENRSLLFRLVSPTGTSALIGDTLVFDLTVMHTDVESGVRRAVQSEPVVLTYSSPAACEAEQPDAAVMEAVALLRAAAAREEALRLDRERRYEESAATLARAARLMRAAAPTSPLVLNEADALQAYSDSAEAGLTAMSRKRMHYEKATRNSSRTK